MIGDPSWWDEYIRSQSQQFRPNIAPPTPPVLPYPQTPQQTSLLNALLTPQNLTSLLLTGKLPDGGSGPILNALLRPPAAVPPTTGAAPVVPVTSQPLAPPPGTPSRDLWTRSPWGASAPTSFSGTGIDPAYVNQVMKGENFSATPYRDGAQMSIGFGTRWLPGQPDNISRATGRNLLMNEINNAGSVVNRLPLPAGTVLNPSQRHALIDLTYNAGPAWSKGTNPIGQAIRQGDFNKAADLISNYGNGRGYFTTQAGKFLPGLQARRDWTANLLRQGVATTPSAPAITPPANIVPPTATRNIVAPPVLNAQPETPIVPRVVVPETTTLEQAFPGATQGWW